MNPVYRAFERVSLQPGQQAVVPLTIEGDNLDSFLLHPNDSARGQSGQVELELGGLKLALPSKQLACYLALAW